MTDNRLRQTVKQLEGYLQHKRRLNPNMDQEQAIHTFLSQIDLTPSEHHAIVDEFRHHQESIIKKLTREDS